MVKLRPAIPSFSNEPWPYKRCIIGAVCTAYTDKNELQMSNGYIYQLFVLAFCQSLYQEPY